MAKLEIKNLQELIKPVLDKNKKYVSTKIAKLTAAGDNYGSLMLSVDITIENEKAQTEHLTVVAKMLPQNEFIETLFNSQRTYRNEVGFYQIIAPCLRELQKEQGLSEFFNSFPAFYNARMSLNPASTRVDEDAVLLIKNIKDEGFINIDRTVGFDLDQTKLILKKMVELHGTTIALKALKPDIFEKKLGQFFEEFRIFDVGAKGSEEMTNSLIDTIKDDEFCAQHLEKIRQTLETNSSHIHTKNNKEFHQGPFLSFVHSDMWSNNIMVKIVGNKPIDVKFVDFQIYEYSSLTRDVIFFLFSSVEFPVIQKHCDDLLRFYYDDLINYLKKLKCDTSAFSYESFIAEIKKMLQTFEFYHIMLMLAPIYAKQEDTRNIEEMDMDEAIQQRTRTSNICKQKGYFIVKEFIKRGWI
ncbi:EcKinase and/or DUF1679 domain containing protein [Asbolus verrucosus]|uniref:EcKinase and/or DUF1679 domain containing protein n=1 Tax=Asbolus verrucosus TaxID=1661398 RepID=A0A482VXY6_ASBVE|nr:EcKinase and/or DUF1679 domain containing protein [Asbolus verrucosus]